jgi:hypothetical protein
MKTLTFVTCNMDASCAKCEQRAAVPNQPVFLCAAAATADKKNMLLFSAACTYRGTLTVNLNDESDTPPGKPGKN